MAKLARDRVLLLRRTPFGESSLVVQGLARRHGRVHLLAKGAYRATSRFAHVLDLADTLELEWRPGTGDALATLVAGRIAERRRAVSSSPASWRAATAGLELTELAARHGDPDSDLFDVLEALLARLDAGAPPELALAVFELGFLGVLGIAPALTACAACGETAPAVTRDGARAAFSSGAGGRLCLRHAEEARASGRRVGTLPIDVLAAAARWSSEDFAALAAAPPPPALVTRVRDFVCRFLDYHVEARPASHRRFLAAPDRNRADGT